jgi:hypothetical protein
MNRHVRMFAGQWMAVAAAAGLAAVSGCETAPKNEGRAKSYRIESRLPDEAPELGSADLVVASDRAVEQIARTIGPRPSGEPTIIVMDRVENSTSDPTANFQIYLARIRANLNQSGARRNLAFVETRQKADAIKEREGVDPVEHARTRPQFALTGTFYDLPRGGTNYYLLTFQMMDLGNDLVVWEGTYEVKL